MMSNQMTALNDLWTEYQKDERFDHLRKPGINFVPGMGPLRPSIMIIGEAPGRMENAKRLPFVGKAGNNLTELLLNAHIDPHEDVFITNTLKYWPRTASGQTRKPDEDEIEVCREYMDREIEIVSPTIIGLCGGVPLKTFYPEKQGIKSVHGILLDNKFVPLYHPAHYLYQPDKKSLVQSGYILLKNFVDTKVKS
jgi:uracil-DNA glycosylase